MIYYGLSDIGRKRKQNQDSFYCGENDRGEYLGIICDGIGGGKAGDVASKIACEWISQAFLGRKAIISDRKNRQWLNEIISNVNDEIFSQATSTRSQKGMGTTLAGVLVTSRATYVFHLGDSRVYALYNDDFVCLTEDHNLASDLVKSGELKLKDALKHPRGSMLTNALGIWGSVNIDINKIKSNYDLLMISSDGLHGYVSDKDIKSILTANIMIEDKVKLLVRESNEIGGYDNVSVIIMSKEDEEHD